MTEQLYLGALFAHPSNGGLRIIAGPDDTELTDIVIEATESELPADGEGRIAILTATPPNTPWQHDALIRRTSDRGFRALAVQHADRFGAGARTLAGRLRLTLLHVDKPMVLAKACWQLVEARDALILSYVRKVAHSIEHHVEGLPDLLRHLSSSVGHGIALIDAGTVLLEAGGHLDAEVHAAIDFTSWLDLAHVRGVGNAASVRVDSPSREGLRIAFFGAGLSESQLRALAVAAEVAMPAVAARILIDEVAALNDTSVSSGLLRDFIDLSGAPDRDVERRMLERGWNTTGHHLAFRIIGRTRLDAVQLLRFVTRHLGTVASHSHVTTSGRGVSGWHTFTELPTPQQLEAHVAVLRELHAAVRRAFNVATGVSSLENGSVGLAAALGEAADAARIAANRSATGWFVRIDGLGLEQLLLAWTSNDTFVPAAESLLAPLRESSVELLTTLSAYLDHESRIAATATALGLHRNTVSTRIQRVQELLRVDMADPEARLALHLACRAVQT